MQNIWKSPIFPVVMADSKKGTSCSTSQSERKMVKPSQLPLYDTDNKYEYWVPEPSHLEEGVALVRKEVLSLCSGVKHYTDKVVDTYEIGKAHTMTTVNFVLDEENVTARAGVIGVGGLLGLLVGMRKKGLIRKLFYTTIGTGGAASVLHPEKSYEISLQGVEEAKTYANIGYNFVAGVKPDEVFKSVAAKLETVSPVVEKPKVEESSVAMKKEETKVVTSKQLIKPDFGQSNPEDKDMYTTRG